MGGKRKNRKRHSVLILIKKKAGVTMIVSVTTLFSREELYQG